MKEVSIELGSFPVVANLIVSDSALKTSVDVARVLFNTLSDQSRTVKYVNEIPQAKDHHWSQHTAGLTSTYTIDDVTFIGNPRSLAAGSATLTLGGLPFTSKGHAFLIPASATGGLISVDGKPATLLSSSAQGSSAGNTPGDFSVTTGRFGVGFGPVGALIVLLILIALILQNRTALREP